MYIYALVWISASNNHIYVHVFTNTIENLVNLVFFFIFDLKFRNQELSQTSQSQF